MQLGSETFDTYARNLRRIYWIDFIDRQMEERRSRAQRLSEIAHMRAMSKDAVARDTAKKDR